MGFEVIPTEIFKKEAKRLIKKFPSLKEELFELDRLLTDNPKSGIDLGHNTFKIRLGIKSKGKGKRGGGRVITYVLTKEKEVYLLTIFNKSEKDTIDNKTIKSIIENLHSK
jgi:mRNA-degrading endonuclease RelE of RelBE toxin-antitoxin system